MAEGELTPAIASSTGAVLAAAFVVATVLAFGLVVAVTPWASRDADMMTIHGVRNFDYRTETDFTPAGKIAPTICALSTRET